SVPVASFGDAEDDGVRPLGPAESATRAEGESVDSVGLGSGQDFQPVFIARVLQAGDPAASDDGASWKRVPAADAGGFDGPLVRPAGCLEKSDAAEAVVHFQILRVHDGEDNGGA